MGDESISLVLCMDTEPCPVSEDLEVPKIPGPPRIPNGLCMSPDNDWHYGLDDPGPLPWTDEGGLEP